MKNIILALGLFTVVSLGIVAIGSAKTDSCSMCSTGTVCAMCDSQKHCDLKVTDKNAKVCCGACKDMKISTEDCRKQCAELSTKN